ncbi:MAG: isoprenylcysteine carboxylmethyltransferase family protein [Acidobacteriales bacterium]|nr:isoprenylcysteine carboxylmethyltransferase family protein [Terriglobales bacterium]
MVLTSWVVYWVLMGVQYVFAELDRRRTSDSPRRKGDGRALAGLLLEVIGFATALGFPRGYADAAPQPLLWCGAVLAVVAVLVSASGARSLGREFRVRAVVTEDHRLVTSGPYRIVRHPIFASLLALLLATGITITEWWALAVAVAIFVAGTEVRVRAEEALLAARFGPEFEAYRAQTSAYIPLVR